MAKRTNIRIAIYDHARKDKALHPSAKVVFNVLVFAFGDKDDLTCFPHHSTIAERTGLSLPTVKRQLRNLEAAGYIRIRSRRGRGNSNSYRVRPEVLKSQKGVLKTAKIREEQRKSRSRPAVLLATIHESSTAVNAWNGFLAAKHLPPLGEADRQGAYYLVPMGWPPGVDETTTDIGLRKALRWAEERKTIKEKSAELQDA